MNVPKNDKIEIPKRVLALLIHHSTCYWSENGSRLLETNDATDRHIVHIITKDRKEIFAGIPDDFDMSEWL